MARLHVLLCLAVSLSLTLPLAHSIYLADICMRVCVSQYLSLIMPKYTDKSQSKYISTIIYLYAHACVPVCVRVCASVCECASVCPSAVVLLCVCRCQCTTDVKLRRSPSRTPPPYSLPPYFLHA